jgi:putative heme iron utilization protein
VQAEALAPDDLAALFEAALHRGWDEHASARLAEREQDERARLQQWLTRSLRRAP